jgi:hypothetical protein
MDIIVLQSPVQAQQTWHNDLITVIQQPLAASFYIIFLAVEGGAGTQSLPQRPLKPFRPKASELPTNSGLDLQGLRVDYDIVLWQVVLTEYVVFLVAHLLTWPPTTIFLPSVTGDSLRGA